MSDDGFILAIYFNQPERVKCILELGKTPPDVRDNFAIQYACDLGYTKIVKMLLSYESVRNFDTDYLLTIAKQHNHEDIIKLLENVYKAKKRDLHGGVISTAPTTSPKKKLPK